MNNFDLIWIGNKKLAVLKFLISPAVTACLLIPIIGHIIDRIEFAWKVKLTFSKALNQTVNQKFKQNVKKNPVMLFLFFLPTKVSFEFKPLKQTVLKHFLSIKFIFKIIFDDYLLKTDEVKVMIKKLKRIFLVNIFIFTKKYFRSNEI